MEEPEELDGVCARSMVPIHSEEPGESGVVDATSTGALGRDMDIVAPRTSLVCPGNSAGFFLGAMPHGAWASGSEMRKMHLRSKS